SWITQAATSCKKYQINVCPANCPFNHTKGQQSLGLHFSFRNKYLRRQALGLHRGNIRFLEDLLVFRTSNKLSWHEFNTHFRPTPKGPIPS
ncbi:11304_t:CDS:1, partial [Acaulospora morrowiae]